MKGNIFIMFCSQMMATVVG